MKTNKQKKLEKSYIFNNDHTQILKENKIVSSKFIKYINENEFEIFLNNKAKVLVNSQMNYLDILDQEYIINNWQSHFQKHITNSWDFIESDFKNGYCYVAQQWITENNESLIVLYYHH